MHDGGDAVDDAANRFAHAGNACESQESGYLSAKPVMTSVTKEASSVRCCQRWLGVMRVTVRG